MNERYFRCLGGDESYESVRLSLDAAWNHVAPMTCIAPAAIAPRDSQGRIILAVWSSFCQYDAAAAALPGLLAGGVVEEIDEATYRAAVALLPSKNEAE